MTSYDLLYLRKKITVRAINSKILKNPGKDPFFGSVVDVLIVSDVET
jgi:hypothetical protein